MPRSRRERLLDPGEAKTARAGCCRSGRNDANFSRDNGKGRASCKLATNSMIPLVFDRDGKPIKDYYISAVAWYFCSRCSQAGSSKLLKPGKPASKVRAGGTDLR